MWALMRHPRSIDVGSVFFSLPNTYPCAGLFTVWHGALLAATAFLVAVGLCLSRGMGAEAARRMVRVITAVLWALEVAKILFVLLVAQTRNPNEFLPLYYCSIILYAGLLSSQNDRFWRRVGDAFIVMGGIVGGVVFLVFPTTSLPQYPAFHFISWHSFLLHGTMVYLGLLLLLTGVYREKMADLRPVATLTSLVCAVAFIFNTVYNQVAAEPVANLMFISRDFEGTPLSLVYRLCGQFFTPVMWLGQSFLPFFVTYGGIRLARALAARPPWDRFQKRERRRVKNENHDDF